MDSVTITAPRTSQRSRAVDLLGRAWAFDKPLTLVGAAMGAVLVAAAIGLLADPRVVTGAPAWLKPAKFAISISIYSFTLVWLLTKVDAHRRWVRLASWSTAVALAIEMVIITGAAAAGETSHFNISTPLHAAMWSTMGGAIVVVWVSNLLVGVLLLIQRMADVAFAWSLRLGIAISALGMGVAFFMTSPTPKQVESARSGEAMTTVGAHSVGVADGGPGLPIVGWSTVGGDLRVAHFVGLHALQVIPLVGLAIARFAPGWLRPAHRAALVWTAGASYAGIVVLLTWQALRGQSVVRPDALTLSMLAGIVAVAGIAVAAIVRRAR